VVSGVYFGGYALNAIRMHPKWIIAKYANQTVRLFTNGHTTLKTTGGKSMYLKTIFK
jgi:hypothetical protein